MRPLMPNRTATRRQPPLSDQPGPFTSTGAGRTGRDPATGAGTVTSESARFRSARCGWKRALLVAAIALGCSAAGAARADNPSANPNPDPGGTAFDPLKPPKTYSMVPTNPTDHFVNGKYDKTGTYIPPHYEPVSKPAFHGYFYKPKHKEKKDQFGNPIPDQGANGLGGDATGN